MSGAGGVGEGSGVAATGGFCGAAAASAAVFLISGAAVVVVVVTGAGVVRASGAPAGGGTEGAPEARTTPVSASRGGTLRAFGQKPGRLSRRVREANAFATMPIDAAARIRMTAWTAMLRTRISPSMTHDRARGCSVGTAQNDHRMRLHFQRVAGIPFVAHAKVGNDLVRVEDALPFVAPRTVRQFEVDRFVVRIEEEIETVVDDRLAAMIGRRDRASVEERADRPRECAVPVLIRHLLAVGLEPADVAHAAHGASEKPAAPLEVLVLLAKANEPAREGEQSVIDVLPVVPGELVVLAVRIVVAALRAADLVAAQQHRHALREKERRQEITLLPSADRDDLRIGRRTFGAGIPGAVVVRAVVVVLAVGFVVFLVVRHEIAQREAVVRRDEVDARVRLASVVGVEIGAAGEPRREVIDHLIGAAPIVADRVAILAVPLRPERRKVSDLISPFADVPRFGDPLHLRDDRVL